MALVKIVAAVALAALLLLPNWALAQTCLSDPAPDKAQASNNTAYPICYQEPIDTNKPAYLALQQRHLLETFSRKFSAQYAYRIR